MDLKLSFPLIFWLIRVMIQEKHWEYNAMATESRESIAFGKQGRDKYYSRDIFPLVSLQQCHLKPQNQQEMSLEIISKH